MGGDDEKNEKMVKWTSNDFCEIGFVCPPPVAAPRNPRGRATRLQATLPYLPRRLASPRPSY